MIGMDKASISRTCKRRQSRDLIISSLDDGDGRLRLANLTKKGRDLHDQIVGVVLDSKQAFSVGAVEC